METITRRLEGLDGRMLALEKCQVQETTVTGGRVDGMEKKLAEHEATLKESINDRKLLTMRVQDLESRMKLVYWIIGTVAGVVIVALTGALIALVLK